MAVKGIEMRFINFTIAALTLRGLFPFSVTSWIRSEKRNKEVGGLVNSYHLFGLAVDVVLDNPADKGRFIKAAKQLGLDAIDEGDHVHVEVR